MFSRLIRLSVLYATLCFSTSFAFSQLPTEEQFRLDALQDAALHFPDSVSLEAGKRSYVIYKGFTADLNGDGDVEWIVSGSLDRLVNSVIVYYRKNDSWNHLVINRCLGGSVVDIKIVDVDNDGRPEVYSILQDDNLKRYCRIMSMSGLEFKEVFTLDTPGGLYCSTNISLTRATSDENYRVRVDEVEYPSSEGGDVRQRIYFYKMVDRMYVLDHMIGGRR